MSTLDATDQRDLAVAVARMATDSGDRVSFDDVLAAYGHTHETLDVLPDE